MGKCIIGPTRNKNIQIRKTHTYICIILPETSKQYKQNLKYLILRENWPTNILYAHKCKIKNSKTNAHIRCGSFNRCFSALQTTIN